MSPAARRDAARELRMAAACIRQAARGAANHEERERMRKLMEEADALAYDLERPAKRAEVPR